MYLLLDVEWRRLDDEVAPVLVVLPAPDELWIEVGVARVPNFLSSEVLGLENRLVLGGRDVQALVVGMTERLDFLLTSFRGGGSLCHVSSPSPRWAPPHAAHARTPGPL